MVLRLVLVGQVRAREKISTRLASITIQHYRINSFQTRIMVNMSEEGMR